MSEQHIDLRGSSYISTPDVNLLDADTAHMHQSQGVWWEVGGSNADGARVADASAFGGYVWRITQDTDAATGFSGTQSGTSGVPISASTQYTLAVDVEVQTDREYKVVALNYDSGGGYLSETSGSYGTDGRPSVTFTTHASAAYLRFRVYWQATSGTIGVGESFDVQNPCLQAGSDATFVPSLRIVGDLDLRAKIAYDAAAELGIIARWDITDNNRGYGVWLTSAGYAVIGASADGAAVTSRTFNSTALPSAGTAFTLRLTSEVGGNARIYLDDVLQGQIHSGVPAPTAVNAPLQVGARDGGIRFTGKVYWAEARDGIDGPVVARFDASTLTEADVVAGEVTQ